MKKKGQKNRIRMGAYLLVFLLFLTGCGKDKRNLDSSGITSMQQEQQEETTAQEEETKDAALENPKTEETKKSPAEVNMGSYKEAQEKKKNEQSLAEAEASEEAKKQDNDETEETKETEEEEDMIMVKEKEVMIVSASSLNLRRHPSMDAEVLARLSRGDEVEKTRFNDDWTEVEFRGQTGYVSSEYLVSKEEKETAGEESTAQQNTGGHIIAIDAGHQDHANNEQEPIGPGAAETKPKVSSGTQGISTNKPEYVLNLEVSLKLKQELIDRGYQVVMIRETNEVNLSNQERASIANDSGAEAFVRIHANSSTDTSINGTLTMAPTASNPYLSNLYSKCHSLAQHIVDSICEQTGSKNMGIQETDGMSGINWCTVPVAIVEMGFMSNPEEDQRMSEEGYQDKIVTGIANGLDAYFTEQ